MTTEQTRIRLKRIYEPVADDDGLRILVERLWPRAFTKQRAAVDFWCKDVAPSPELRRWFAHDPQKWPQFCARYSAELMRNPALLAWFKSRAAEGTVTLLYAARDDAHNSAVVLRELLSRPEREHR